MKNFVQPGDVVTLPAPAGGIQSGQPFAFGGLFGVAAYSAVAGYDVETQLVGVFDLPKGGGAISVGAKVYWDATNKVVTGTATNNALIGVCTAAAGAPAVTVRVRLNGVSLA